MLTGSDLPAETIGQVSTLIPTSPMISMSWKVCPVLLAILCLPIEATTQGSPVMAEIGDVSAIGSNVDWVRSTKDGRWMVLSTSANDDAWIFDRTTRSLRRLALTEPMFPTWSPANNDLAFSYRDESGRYTIWTLGQAGSGQLRRVGLSDAEFPVYSPDGSSIAFIGTPAECNVAVQPDCRWSSIMVMPARGGEARSMQMRGSPLAWSGDGRWLYVHAEVPGAFQFYRLPINGGSADTLFSIPRLQHHEVGLSGDDRHFAVVLGQVGAPTPATLVTWTADGREVARRELPIGVYPFTWSGANRMIATRVEPRLQLRSISSDGTGDRLLSASWAWDGVIQFSPDGSRIKFASRVPGGLSLGVMNADGSNRRILSNAPLSLGPGRWSPDGRRIAYTTSTASGSRHVVVDLSTGSSNVVGERPVSGQLNWTAGSNSLIYNANVGTRENPVFELREVPLTGGSERALRRLDQPLVTAPITPSMWWRLENGELQLLTETGAQSRTVATGVRLPAGFSSDGQRFAAVLQNNNGAASVMTVGLNGRTTQVPLPTGYTPTGTLAFWHPSGSYFFVLASHQQSGRSRIVQVSTNGSSRVLEAPAEENVTTFDLSPDGSRIVYTSQAAPQQTLFELDVSEWLR